MLHPNIIGNAGIYISLISNPYSKTILLLNSSLAFVEYLPPIFADNIILLDNLASALKFNGILTTFPFPILKKVIPVLITNGCLFLGEISEYKKSYNFNPNPLCK